MLLHPLQRPVTVRRLLPQLLQSTLQPVAFPESQIAQLHLCPVTLPSAEMRMVKFHVFHLQVVSLLPLLQSTLQPVAFPESQLAPPHLYLAILLSAEMHTVKFHAFQLQAVAQPPLL